MGLPPLDAAAAADNDLDDIAQLPRSNRTGRSQNSPQFGLGLNPYWKFPNQIHNALSAITLCLKLSLSNAVEEMIPRSIYRTANLIYNR